MVAKGTWTAWSNSSPAVHRQNSQRASRSSLRHGRMRASGIVVGICHGKAQTCVSRTPGRRQLVSYACGIPSVRSPTSHIPRSTLMGSHEDPLMVVVLEQLVRSGVPAPHISSRSLCMLRITRGYRSPNRIPGPAEPPPRAVGLEGHEHQRLATVLLATVSWACRCKSTPRSRPAQLPKHRGT